ncbi:unnamed protein product [Adineta ricciae]|uniref:G-protein coupled receptors family 1 profile domain-containing protein n=1 Tax=Adineta ricciae TaxID=249248 RepID=A0A813UD83_ADIRI|nr:unnamed protein product [Adineta ricciae]CAF1145284.1 unnamed protein product [Adineta ricciae]
MSTNDTDTSSDYSVLYAIKFAILVALEIPSILVSLVIFAYFGTNRAARLTTQNISIFVLLLINFLQVTTDLPMPMSFFRLNGIVQPATSSYCTWWTFYEFSLNTVNGYVMAWISIERYVLIFHSNFTRNLSIWKRRAFQIIPLIICTLWGPLYYFVTIIISPMCTNTRSYVALLCGLPCYLLTTWGTFDLFCDVILPVLTIFMFNLILFIRAIYHTMVIRRRVQNNWRQHRKMALQLGLISFVYLVIWVPLSIIQLGLNYIDPNFLATYLDTFNFLVYIIPLILPMLCLMSMPDLMKQIKTRLLTCHGVTVVPMNNTKIQRPIIDHRSGMTGARQMPL